MRPDTERGTRQSARPGPVGPPTPATHPAMVPRNRRVRGIENRSARAADVEPERLLSSVGQPMSNEGKGYPRVQPSAVLALIAVMLAVPGCGGDGIPLREDPQLQARAAQVARNGGPVLFRDLAGGDWDRVRVFPGPPPLELVEADIGAQLDVSGTYTPYEDGGVLIFTKDGTVQRAVRLESHPFNGDRGSYSRTVLVARPHPNARSLEFIDPSTLSTPRLR